MKSCKTCKYYKLIGANNSCMVAGNHCCDNVDADYCQLYDRLDEETIRFQTRRSLMNLDCGRMRAEGSNLR